MDSERGRIIRMQNVYTVAQVNTYIKNMFTQDYMLRSIFVKGEVSNCKYHSSGHIYFTLKDAKGTIACVMFAGNRAGLSFTLEEGQMVVVGGTIDVYERDGKYQMYAKQIILDGAGFLYEKYEKLKKQLEEMGMFAQEYKQAIPKFASKIGVVTAPTGAAVRDIINIAKRRNPYVQIILYPAIVQGEQAAQSIVNGIRALEQQQVDVMIVGRGGGSIEDLWAFNEEIVAQAVFDCTVPIISAVGHETDTTIIDYVSDLRAPTPSAAAELAVYDYALLESQIEAISNKITALMQGQMKRQTIRLNQMKMHLKYLSPLSQLQEKRTYCMELEDKLQGRMKSVLMNKKHQLAIYIEKMKGLSPLEKLSQGYAFAENEAGDVINDVLKVKIDQRMHIFVKNGKITAKVEQIQKGLEVQNGTGNDA